MNGEAKAQFVAVFLYRMNGEVVMQVIGKHFFTGLGKSWNFCWSSFKLGKQPFSRFREDCGQLFLISW